MIIISAPCESSTLESCYDNASCGLMVWDLFGYLHMIPLRVYFLLCFAWISNNIYCTYVSNASHGHHGSFQRLSHVWRSMSRGGVKLGKRVPHRDGRHFPSEAAHVLGEALHMEESWKLHYVKGTAQEEKDKDCGFFCSFVFRYPDDSFVSVCCAHRGGG
ncbi:uncharacterized protein LY79DRAFT_126705 [Colletotrichum navitas]|uniref:Uncharacterized protein n=1 Tax=Colletotrichum navitas TaxID=681940 RepID=A0AAD8Q3F7_9PEZI|nr:uncharacterized protein LY79DRAFT_126705 [Colletotrichum navitas]KAK1594819.1 hypothetical protein LY79DRAFT_126705 [Colletotrichum navitas]